MAYATRQDMIDRFSEAELVQLTDKDAVRADSIVETVLERALADASATINAYLAGRYTLPLDPSPEILRLLACDIARYYLQIQEAGAQVKARYEGAVKFLGRVASGEIRLGVDAAGAPPAATGTRVQFSSGQKAFGRENFGDAR
jgi:phage gp36-like protein